LLFTAAGTENPHSYQQDIGNIISMLIAFLFNYLYSLYAPIQNSGTHTAGDFPFEDTPEETAMNFSYPVKFLYCASEKWFSKQSFWRRKVT
jgi:hypothetical protein